MKTTIKLFSLALASMATFVSCSDQFLQDKKDYDKTGSEIYNYYSGCNGRLNDIYALCLPATSANVTWQYPSIGKKDLVGKSTEEYSGFSDFVDPQVELSSTSSSNEVPDFFMGTAGKVRENSYGRIRDINDAIAGFEASEGITDEERDQLLGQAYFLRAWCYYNMFKWYGGVPIVTEVLDPVSTSFTDRSSSKETYEFILSDLDKAAKLLAAKTMNGGWQSSSDNGRVTTGTALALKGRVMLLWCSPLFNRTDDTSRWTTAYKTMKAELDSITACGYHLYGATDGGSDSHASNFNKMFCEIQNPEAVFVALHNNKAYEETQDDQKNNYWEKSIRPANTGASGINPSQMLIGEFPMKDGKVPSAAGTYTKLTSSKYDYNAEYPFLNRDPRFYRTYAFPGFRWAYNGDGTEADANNPKDGTNYVLWNYVWYTNETDQGDIESGSAYGADNLLSSVCGVYVRKKTDDLDVNSPLYEYKGTYQKGCNPFFSGAPLLVIRYAEVLLNLAEVAAGAGELSEAVEYVKQIRQRVGYTGDCGISDNAASDRATCFSQILYERQIEFAFEGMRFDDLRRWMLYDGGTGKVDGAPSTWTLSGFGGNTCSYLGFTQLNGQRRENMEYRVANKYGVGGTTYASDPLVKAGVERPASVDLREADLDAQLTSLSQWYSQHLVKKIKKGDAYDSNKNQLYMNFRPKYYFLGFTSGASSNNKGLPQTIGWGDYNNGGANGTFDPLAE